MEAAKSFGLVANDFGLVPVVSNEGISCLKGQWKGMDSWIFSSSMVISLLQKMGIKKQEFGANYCFDFSDDRVEVKDIDEKSWDFDWRVILTRARSNR